MTYEQFQILRSRILRERPSIADRSETNLYASLAHLVPVMPAPMSANVHRCDLALEWTALFGLPADWAERALVSNGVRDSLARLFGCYARRGKRAWIPADCYPVFQRLAEANALQFGEYATFPRTLWPADNGDLLLAMNPLKPAGRCLNAQDVSVLMRWLAANPSRRLLLDTVYTFGTTFHESTLELVRGGQTILLHSLTKGWLRPRVFGVALVPPHDVETLAPVFRQQPPSPVNLAEARFLINERGELPERVAAAIENPMGYFHPIARPWAQLLADGILGIPSAVFGSMRRDITILSSLEPS